MQVIVFNPNDGPIHIGPTPVASYDWVLVEKEDVQELLNTGWLIEVVINHDKIEKYNPKVRALVSTMKPSTSVKDKKTTKTSGKRSRSKAVFVDTNNEDDSTRLPESYESED